MKDFTRTLRAISFLSLSFCWSMPVSQAVAQSEYWDSGLAEITRYELKQAQYGTYHEGEAILLFVTEPFSTDSQVKDDSGRDPGAERILKLNAFKRFNTGIYDYSIMSSVFSSVQPGLELPTFKVTTSVQDWCGQVFHQWNQRNGMWQSELRSYFQAAGDRDEKLELAPQEDGIWNRLRIDPQSLPQGTLEMIPSSSYLRLGHQAVKAYRVEATLKSGSYRLHYPELKRSLTIDFREKAPFEITGWQESYPGSGDKVLTTVAKKTHSLRSYYWEQNQPSFLKLRKKLGLK